MAELSQDIGEIVESVWGCVLSLPFEREEHSSLPATRGRLLTGVVQIHGAWDGIVMLQFRESLARRVTHAMLGLGYNEIDMSDLRETTAELVNITGGNLKARLPNSCTLGLPMVVDGDDFRLRMPGRARAMQCAFACDGEPFTVMVMQRIGDEPDRLAA